jgi:hypothetical protein
MVGLLGSVSGWYTDDRWFAADFVDFSNERSMAMAKAYLEITLAIDDADRPAAAQIYTRYRQPFLREIAGAQSKELLIRSEDVQVLHGFDTLEQASAYLKSQLFVKDVAGALGPLLQADPEIRVYQVA